MTKKIIPAAALCLLGAALLDPPAAAGANGRDELGLYFSEEDMVEATTRAPKPMNQVAENVSIVTAEEIRRMNAHTTAEVLDRVPGVYLTRNGRDFGMTASMQIQGSEFQHVLVLVDGLDWNFLSGGSANLNTIPVAIIKRIEVIRGPASSTWGSSLGGVVNIITKDPEGKNPHGRLFTSYGEKDSLDSHLELKGPAGPANYYLFAGKQHSDGLRNNRNFDNQMLYGKAKLTLSPRYSLGLTAGYSEPEVNYGHFANAFLFSDEADRAFWTTLQADATLSDTLTLHASVSTYDQEFALHLAEDGTYAPAGELYRTTINEETKRGVNCRLVWKYGIHTVVAGMEYLRSELEASIASGAALTPYGYPPVFLGSGNLDETAFFVNDTIILGNFTLTPGVRYDHNSITNSFTSPSLGLTYQLSPDSLFRALAARGFNLPDLADNTIGGAFYDPNPDLDSEEIVSLQAGFETRALKYLRLKATYFNHELKDAITQTTNPATGNGISVNADRQRRQGFELEARTIPLHHCSLEADFSYVHKEKYGISPNQHQYTANLALLYDRDSLSAGLYGHYIWYDYDTGADYDDFIWDLTVSKRLKLAGSLEADLIFSGHNILNGTQENHADYPTVERWLEAGVRFYF